MLRHDINFEGIGEEEKDTRINIKKNIKKKLILLNKEIRKVNKMTKIIDKKIEAIKKDDLFVSYQDIIGNDSLNNYIVIKSNVKANPEIKILSEDDLEYKDLNMNSFTENFIPNMNKVFSFNELNQNLNSQKKEIEDINNIKKNSSSVKKEKPIELIFLSPENQSFLNNNNIINNNFNI